MKKDRNAFFQNNSASSYFYPGPSIPNNYGAYPMATESSSNFYQGPILQPQANSSYTEHDIETRLAKIERSLNRLDTRVTKLESEIDSNPDNYTNQNNMYMV